MNDSGRVADPSDCTMVAAGFCRICSVMHENLLDHMQTHSKSEMINAFLGGSLQNASLSVQTGCPAPANTSNYGSQLCNSNRNNSQESFRVRGSDFSAIATHDPNTVIQFIPTSQSYVGSAALSTINTNLTLPTSMQQNVSHHSMNLNHNLHLPVGENSNQSASVKNVSFPENTVPVANIQYRSPDANQSNHAYIIYPSPKFPQSAKLAGNVKILPRQSLPVPSTVVPSISTVNNCDRMPFVVLPNSSFKQIAGNDQRYNNFSSIQQRPLLVTPQSSNCIKDSSTIHSLQGNNFFLVNSTVPGNNSNSNTVILGANASHTVVNRPVNTACLYQQSSIQLLPSCVTRQVSSATNALVVPQQSIQFVFKNEGELNPSSRISSYKSSLPTPCFKISSKSNNLNMNQDSAPRILVNETTIQVGKNIKITVPKDMANKKERLQQIINEELIRGILLNDSSAVHCETNSCKENAPSYSLACEAGQKVSDMLCAQFKEPVLGYSNERCRLQDQSSDAIIYQQPSAFAGAAFNAIEPASSEKIYVSESNLYQNSDSPYSTIDDPLAVQATVRSSFKTSSSGIAENVVPSSSLNDPSICTRTEPFVTTFKNIIKKDCTNSCLDCGSGHSEGRNGCDCDNSSFRVINFNECDQESETNCVAVELSVKDEDNDEVALFSPFSVASSGSEQCSISSETTSSGRRLQHDEDLSLRAAETLADSDSEHAVHDCRADPSTDMGANALMNSLCEDSPYSESSLTGRIGSWSSETTPKLSQNSFSSPSGPRSTTVDLRKVRVSTSSMNCNAKHFSSPLLESLPRKLFPSSILNNDSNHSNCELPDPSETVAPSNSSVVSLRQVKFEAHNTASTSISRDLDSAVVTDGLLFNLDSCVVVPQTHNSKNISVRDSPKKSTSSNQVITDNFTSLNGVEEVTNLKSDVDNAEESSDTQAQGRSELFSRDCNSDGHIYSSPNPRRSTGNLEHPCQMPAPKVCSPEPSTSGLHRTRTSSQHDTEYEFEYDSDYFADSDTEAMVGRSVGQSHDGQWWKCHICSKTFKSFKEKLLHSSKHSSNCLEASGKRPVFESPTPSEAKFSNYESQVVAVSKTVKVEMDDPLLSVNMVINDLYTHKEGVENLTDTGFSNEFSCPDCPEKFTEAEDLLAHRIRALQSKNICPFCHEEFDNYTIKGSHLRAQHLKQYYVCGFCYNTQKSIASWRRHMLFHLGLVMFECKQCGRRFARKFELQAHMRVHTSERQFVCPECNRQFSCENNLQRHMSVHIDSQEVQCDTCCKVYKNERSLTKHRSRAHPPPDAVKIPRTFMCDFEGCSRSFISQKKLLWHQNVHKRWPLQCKVCNEKFVYNGDLIKHIRNKHDSQYQSNEKGNKTCPVCKKVLRSTSFRIHMLIHSNQKPFKCQLCSKKFRAKCNLEAHMSVHAGQSDRPFQCNICPRGFNREKELEAHLRSHKNIRPYVCNECGKSFIHKNNLVMHTKLHGGPKEYVCCHCGRAFHRKYNLQNHERVHTGSAPFKCSFCPKTFTQKSNYNVHKRTIHGDRRVVNEEI